MKRTIQSLAIAALVAGGLFFGAQAAHAHFPHEVVPGDWVSKIASTHGTTTEALVAANPHIAANPNLIFPGQIINGPSSGSTTAVAGVSTSQPSQVSSAPQQVVQRGYGGPNGYDYGWCTWWVKEKRPDIGGYWGNAGYNWLTAARNAGFSTGSYPAPGAIGVMHGHVVYVESVSGNMVNISEMGYNYVPEIVTYRTVPASSFVYIY